MDRRHRPSHRRGGLLGEQSEGRPLSFFVLHTYYWGDRHRDIFLGPERTARINPLASAAEAGLRFTDRMRVLETVVGGRTVYRAE